MQYCVRTIKSYYRFYTLRLTNSSRAAFVTLLKEITKHPAYSALKSDPNIYTTGDESGEDYDNLLNAARKAVEHGYRVFILPNPKGFRTADFVFERKGVYKMFDLKTITGKSSLVIDCLSLWGKLTVYS